MLRGMAQHDDLLSSIRPLAQGVDLAYDFSMAFNDAATESSIFIPSQWWKEHAPAALRDSQISMALAYEVASLTRLVSRLRRVEWRTEIELERELALSAYHRVDTSFRLGGLSDDSPEAQL